MKPFSFNNRLLTCLLAFSMIFIASSAMSQSNAEQKNSQVSFASNEMSDIYDVFMVPVNTEAKGEHIGEIQIGYFIYPVYEGSRGGQFILEYYLNLQAPTYPNESAEPATFQRYLSQEDRALVEKPGYYLNLYYPPAVEKHPIAKKTGKSIKP